MDKWIFCFCVQCIFNIQLSACDDILILKDGVEISYNVTRSDYCRTGENKVQLFLDLSLTDCVIECGLRNHCLSLSYHHGMHSCLLLRSTDTSDVIDAPCDYILKSDIVVHKTPCVNECSDGLACDLDTQSCKAKECPLPTPINGTVYGNKLTIGSKVRYKCDVDQTEITGIYTGTCLEDGTWSHIANCEPIVILNVWAEWSPWTPCDVTCGSGTQHRTRGCSTGDDCIDDETDTSSCNDGICPPVNILAEWSPWTPCDVTCGSGTQHRTRGCSTGDDCIDDETDTSSCNDGICPPVNILAEWSPWTPCDVTCDSGTQHRTRSCSTGDGCVGDTTETSSCNEGTCQLVNVWAEWSPWTPCDVTCGSGTQHRTRGCSTGDDCIVDETDSSSCNDGICPPVNIWAEWSPWTPCDVTCDSGTQHRTRSCSTGDDCVGDTTETSSCNEGTCQLENVWAEWSPWTPCDVTCDDGTQHRTRTCSTGDDCDGDTTDSLSCNDGICPVPTDCDDAFQSGQTASGVYPIQLISGENMTVRCSMSPNTGGWTVIQRRISASDFYKTWEEYKIGFGDLNENFWLGNENILALTQTGTWKLRIELTWNGESGYAEYSSFAIGNEASNYILSVGGYSGNMGDSLIPNHDGKEFTTKDRDNDLKAEKNCAIVYGGAWWYKRCHDANLNGVFGSTGYGQGLNWRTWSGYYESVDTTEMKIQLQ